MSNLDAASLAVYVTAGLYVYIRPIDNAANKIAMFVFLSFVVGLGYSILAALLEVA